MHAPSYSPEERKRLDLQLHTFIATVSALMFVPIVLVGWGNWPLFAVLTALCVYSGASNGLGAKLMKGLLDRRWPNVFFFTNNLVVALAAGMLTGWSTAALVRVAAWVLCFSLTASDNVIGFVVAFLAITCGCALVQGADPVLVVSIAMLGLGMYALVSQRSRILHAALEQLGHEMKARLAAEVEARQAQKLQAVGRLAAGVAHEINTPVQFVHDSMGFLAEGVGNLSGLLKQYREHLPESARAELRAAEERADLDYVLQHLPESVGTAKEGLERIAKIVKSMREFAHPDASEMKPADLNRAIESTLTIAASEYRQVADVERDLQPLPEVTCHAGELNQLVLNLVVNASHAIADRVGKSGARGLITVSTRVEGEHVVVAVKDTGSGIPAHVQPHLFEPFFTTKPVGRGTGQGLTIVKSIAERHGGRVWFETKEGSGTTFFVSVMVQPPRLAKVLPLVRAA